MILSVLFGIIAAVCLVSTVVYVFMRSRGKLKSPLLLSAHEKQHIKYSIRPTMETVAKKLSPEFSFRASLSSSKSDRSTSTTTNDCEDSASSAKKEHKSVESIDIVTSPFRSTSASVNLSQLRPSRSSGRRQGSIVELSQMASIPFSLPISTNNNKYRRRSVAVCDNINELRESLISASTLAATIGNDEAQPCLLSFSMICLKSSQIKIQIHSIQSLPAHVQLQQLTIKAKLMPDGKEKAVLIKQQIRHEATFPDDSDQYSILFSNVSLERLHERSLVMAVSGKDQARKTVQLGQVGKINFNQIDKLENENRVEFIHAIEKTKPSSIEILVGLRKNDDQHVRVDVQRIKGLKVDQKKLDATCCVKVVLLDRHRPLSIQKTKTYRLKSANVVMNDEFDFNILTYNLQNLDRLMIMLNLYSNANPANEDKCIAHVRLGLPLLCCGSGSVHWQQFKARESFSMWHTLNKEQH